MATRLREAPVGRRTPPPVSRPTPRRRRTGRDRLVRTAEQVAVLAAAVGMWQLVTVWADSFFFPPPSEVLPRVVENWFTGPASSLFLTPEVGRDVAPSVGRMLAGWSIACVLGVAIGTALGLARRLAGYVDPIIHFLRSAPGPALLPIFMLVFGIGTDMKIIFIAFGSVWPVLLNTIDGVRSVDTPYLDTASAFRTSAARRVVRIVLPAASPRIVAGMRISLAIALVLMVISDMIASSGGFGFTLIEAQRSFQVLDVWASIVLLGLLGFAVNGLFVLGERRLLAWHRGFRGRLGE
jgi:ABC-type nitrate/sulfonate/bicarbonate transport system permease component